ncbi:MAG: hypothetical protein Q7N50_00105 [Armatimonadota bacterium]|nr:hypothetical protein [Armatimonadota bacterium]
MARIMERSKPVKLTTNNHIEPKTGEMMDAAPFGEIRSWEDGKDIGVLWEDFRDIFKVVVEFADAPPDPSTVKLQYWSSVWPKRRVPRNVVSGSGGAGWINIGDWYNGEWIDADVDVKIDGKVWTYTFRSLIAKEFPDLKDFDADYRATYKVRLLFSGKAAQMAAFHAFTDTTWDQTKAIVEWSGNTAAGQVWDKVEAFNGYAANVKPKDGGLAMDIWYSKPVAIHSFDDTIVTIRAKKNSFSFAAKELVKGKRIYIREYGVLVQSAQEPATFEEVEEAYQKATKDLYRQIHDLPEQTLDRAWSDMPRKGRIYMPLAVEGGRQHFGIQPNGDIRMSRNWQMRIQASDSDKAKWKTKEMFIKFGLPHGSKTGACREEGDLPIANTWYEKDGVRYVQDAFATVLYGKLPPEGRINAEEAQALMLRFRFTNCNDMPSKVVLPIEVELQKEGLEPLVEKAGLIYSKTDEGDLLRVYVNTNGIAKLTGEEKTIKCEVEVPARKTVEFYATIAFQTLETADEIAQLKKLNFDEQHKMIAGYWRKRLSESSQLKTPEPMINEFYSAHASHLLINSENEVNGRNDHAMLKVGTFHYGVFSNESVMMTSDMNRRGYHDLVEKCMQTWIDYQSTAELPGDYTNINGVFYGAGGYEDGGYNQHHGWTLWGMAEHYWFTGDKKWLEKAAPNLIKGCDWIIEQRSRTKTDECAGLRAIEYGLMPPGSLEDIPDWRCWMSNNDFNFWGMNNVAKALIAIGHPDGKRLLKEAGDYREDIRKAFFEAMARSPVVALRDGSYVPSIPSEVHRRGRCFGWITETLEGSIYLLRTGVIDPDEPMAQLIMKDYEDNRYLSDSYGYQIPFFERDWFSLGGFSQQPNLLCSPTPYLTRDEIKHYIRAYFNAFAAGYFPERGMITEHPLPNLGDYAGDHFKSSDEALNTSWVRWMFIWDETDELHLGKAIPRYWLADGQEIGVERAQTHFGEMSIRLKSSAASGSIEMTVEPPTRRAPTATYARFRHPEGKSMNRVTVNGKPYSNFNAEKEWVILEPLKEKTVIVAYYD